MYKLIMLALLLGCFSQAQEYISIHEQHKREFGAKKTDNPDNPSVKPVEPGTIIPLKFDKSKASGVTVFGYLPDWEYSAAQNYLRYDILTHIAAFDFTVNTNGYITDPAGWPWTALINKAHGAGVKIVMCVANFTASSIHTIITTSSVKQTFFSQILSKINQYQLDGVNIDFEALSSADKGTAINTFMTDLSAYLKASLPNTEISFAGPALTGSGWIPSGLAQACDYVFIMGYDFWGSWSSTTGASAPYPNISNVVNVQWGTVVNTAPQKMILGVPYYGQKWKARTSSPHSSVASYVSSTRYRDDASTSLRYERLWDTEHEVPWYRYAADTGYYQVWYDNDSSLGLKFGIAQSRNIRGVGMWALGYDNGRQEYWNELARRFYAPSSVDGDEKTGLPESFNLTAYPNPFNPATKICYNVHADTRVTIRLFDIFGKETASLVDQFLPQGSYTYNLNAGNLASGTYIVNVKMGRVVKNLKIMLLK